MNKILAKFILLKNLKLSKSSWLLIVSFSSILLVTFFALIFISVQIKTTQAQINQIVTSNNKKSRLVVEMQQSARDRSLALYSMVSAKGAFDYDTFYENYKLQAALFIKAREAFLSMPLSKKELELINHQGKLSRLALPQQNIIIKLLHKRRFDDAAKRLIKKSIPAQNAVLTQLTKIINFQNDNNEKIVAQLQNKAKESIIIIVTMSVIILLLTILTALYVITRITRSEELLYFEKELA
ncbi:MAG: hypothetical protein KAT06_11545 [Gammaproteobacteria bacterium]|nr:hypothetical protein [Gammaproteobacteria bacterium]